MPPLKSANYICQWVHNTTKSSQDTSRTEFSFEECLKALAVVGVRTDYDMLLQPDALVQTPVALHRHIKALRMHVLDHFSTPGYTAAELLSRDTLNTEQSHHVKSGIVELDKLLGGGLPTRQVSELCCKEDRVATQIAVNFSAAHLLPEHQAKNTKVYYLQSGSLSIWRVEQAICKRLENYPVGSRDTLFRQALERLIVVDCRDVDALLMFLHKYADARATISEEQSCSASSDLLVIDSIRPLIVAVLQLQSEMDIEVYAVKAALRRICSARLFVNSTVLITNGVSQRDTPRIQPSLGTAWGMTSHTHLYVYQDTTSSGNRAGGTCIGDSNVFACSSTRASRVTALVLKSPSVCVGKSTVFDMET